MKTKNLCTIVLPNNKLEIGRLSNSGTLAYPKNIKYKHLIKDNGKKYFKKSLENFKNLTKK